MILLNTRLYGDIASKLAVLPFKKGRSRTLIRPNGDLYLQIQEKLKNEVVWVMGSSLSRQNQFMECLLLIDAAKRAGAKKIEMIAPYFAYLRQDRIYQAGEPLSAHLVIDLFYKAGAHRIFCLDPHSRLVQKKFKSKWVSLNSAFIFAEYFKKKQDILNYTIVAPDQGAQSRCRTLAKQLSLGPIFSLKKKRLSPTRVKMVPPKQIPKIKQAIIFDDEIATGETFIQTLKFLKEMKVKNIYLAATHALFKEIHLQKMLKYDIKKIILTESHPLFQIKHPKITRLSIEKHLYKQLKPYFS